MDLTDIHRTLHPKTIEYTYFTSVHGTFSKTDHMLGHTTSLNKFKKHVFSPQRNETRNQLQGKKKKTGRNTNTGKLNNILVNNQWINEKSKDKITKYLEIN